MVKWLVPFLFVSMMAGCMGDDNAVTIAFQGAGTGSDTKTLDCDTDGRISFGVQGAGSITITVTDGNGDQIYSDSSVGSGQNGQSQTIEGAEGTWTLKVSRGSGYSGQYGITLTC